MSDIDLGIEVNGMQFTNPFYFDIDFVKRSGFYFVRSVEFFQVFNFYHGY